MPRRSILSAAERESLLALPDTNDGLIRHYTFSESDLSIINQRRGAANRLGFAVQLCYLRFPGVILGINDLPFPPLLKLVAGQLTVWLKKRKSNRLPRSMYRIVMERWRRYLSIRYFITRVSTRSRKIRPSSLRLASPSFTATMVRVRPATWDQLTKRNKLYSKETCFQ